LQHERARQNEREKEREKGGEGLSIERSEINFVKREVAAIIITKIWHSVRLDTAGLQDLRVNVHFRSDLTLNVERERERERERENAIDARTSYKEESFLEEFHSVID